MHKSRTCLTVLLIASISALTTSLAAQTGTIGCSSNDGRYHYCRTNTANRVRLVRQLPGSRCQQNFSWGFDYRGIWVDRGCRAEFEYGVHQASDNTGAAIAGGILGAIIVGAIVSSNNDDHKDHQAAQRDYYRDGYRMGQRDWNYRKPPYYPGYKNRFPRAYEDVFAHGYDDGYNNRHGSDDRYDESPNYSTYDGYATYTNQQTVVRHQRQSRTPQPGSADYGTINNPNHGAGPPEPGDLEYRTINHPNDGAGPPEPGQLEFSNPNNGAGPPEPGQLEFSNPNDGAGPPEPGQLEFKPHQ
jgi:hypothetical protein